MQQSTVASFRGQDIFVGLDVHVKSWDVSIATIAGLHKTFTQDPNPEQLVRHLRKNFPGGRYHCAYEAGYCGFWIYEELKRLGVEAMVVNSADVPTSNKERVNKSDRVDSRKLAKSLRLSELEPIYVPPREALEDRTLVRTREQLVRKQTRVKNHIKAILRFYGIRLPAASTSWSKQLLNWIEDLCTGKEEGLQSASGRLALRIHLDELRSLNEQTKETMRAIRQLSNTERYRDRVLYLRSITGIGLLSAMIILTELVHIERFKSFDHLASFAGLIPSKPRSGEYDPDGVLTPRRQSRLRHVLIESAWYAARKDPDQCAAFLRLSQRMPKGRAITRIARKQLARIDYVLRHNQALS